MSASSFCTLGATVEGSRGLARRVGIAVIAMLLISAGCSSDDSANDATVTVSEIDAAITVGSEPPTVATDFVANATETIAGPFEITVRAEPDRPVVISFDIPPEFDGDTADLVIATFDEDRGRWVVLPTSVDLQAGTVSAPTNHFSLFKLVKRISAAIDYVEDLFSSIVLGVPDAMVDCPDEIATLTTAVDRLATAAAFGSADALDVCVQPGATGRDEVRLVNARSYPLLVRSTALASGRVASRGWTPDATALAIGAMAPLYEVGTQVIVLPGQEIVLDLSNRPGGEYTIEVLADPGLFAMKVLLDLVVHLIGGAPDGDLFLDYVDLTECIVARPDLGQIFDTCGEIVLDVILGSAAGPLNRVLSAFAQTFAGVQFLADSATSEDGVLARHTIVDTSEPIPTTPVFLPVDEPAGPPPEWAPPAIDVDPDAIVPPNEFPEPPTPVAPPLDAPPTASFTMCHGDTCAGSHGLLDMAIAAGDATFDATGSTDAEGPVTQLWFIAGRAVSDQVSFPFPLDVLGAGDHAVRLVITDSAGQRVAIGGTIRIAEPAIEAVGHGPLLVTDQVAGEVYTVDPETGDRVLVATGPGPSAAVWTNDKASFVYSTLDLTSDPLQVSYVEVAIDNGATETLTTSKYDFVGVLSPDARQVAGIPFIDLTVIWVVDLGPGESSTVVSVPQGPGTIAWFPDGSGLAFSVCTTTDPACTIRVAEFSPLREPSTRDVGTSPFDLTWGLAVSPDGTTIALASGPWPEGPYDLYLMDLRTGVLTQVTDTPDIDEFRPVFSPDGSSLAFASRQAGDPPSSPSITLETIRIDGSERRAVTTLSTQADGYDWD